MTDAIPLTVLLLIGVSGVGKTSVGRAVAERLGWTFFDADDLHSASNVAKMARGEGLTDADRAPWLDAVRLLIERRMEANMPTVIACSALKAAYRARLREGLLGIGVVWLDADAEVVAARMSRREGHFAGESLLPSQWAVFEPPEADEALRVDASGSVEETTHRVIAALGL